jgi:hypothetical protein
MKEVTLALDSGFGDCKLCIDFKYYKETSALAKLESTSILEDENYVELDGSKYYAFVEAAKLPKSKQLSITNYEELKFATPIFIKAIEKKYNVKVVNLCLGLSIAMIEKAEDFKTYVSNKLGLALSNIKLLPQGIGSKVAYQEYNLDLEDAAKKNDHRSQNYICMDIGFNTIDVFQVINGKLSNNAIRGFEGRGLIKVASKLREYIKSTLELDCDLPSIKEIISKGGLSIRGHYYDLSAKIRELVIDYSVDTFKFFEEEFAESIDKMDNILLVGGGAALLKSLGSEEVQQYLDSKYNTGFMMIPKNPEYYNCLGYYLYASKN